MWAITKFSLKQNSIFKRLNTYVKHPKTYFKFQIFSYTLITYNLLVIHKQDKKVILKRSHWTVSLAVTLYEFHSAT